MVRFGVAIVIVGVAIVAWYSRVTPNVESRTPPQKLESPYYISETNFVPHPALAEQDDENPTVLFPLDDVEVDLDHPFSHDMFGSQIPSR